MYSKTDEFVIVVPFDDKEEAKKFLRNLEELAYIEGWIQLFKDPIKDPAPTRGN